MGDNAMRGRLLVAMPLYTHVSVAWFLSWCMLDKSAMVEHLAVRKLYLEASMCNMVASALKSNSGWDRMVVYEADMMPPVNALNRIADYPDQLDIVGSMYFQHPAPHRPLVYAQVDENHYTALLPNQIDEMMAKPGVYPVDAVGLGFTSIHRRVLEKWDPAVPMFAGGELGHDMWFSREAKRQGFMVHVDSGIECSHLTEWPVGYQDSKRLHTEISETARNTGESHG